MALKDYIQADIDNVFFNTDEFAEPHLIDGRSVNITIDDDRLIHRKQKEFDGISEGIILFFAKAKDFPERYEPDQPIIFNTKMLYVVECKGDSGVYEIILRQNRGV